MRHGTAWESSSLKRVTLTALFWAFIRTIFTVGIPVTLPSIRNTLAIVAYEVRLGACLLHYRSGFAGLKLKSLTQEPYIPTVGTTAFEMLYSKNKAKSISSQLLISSRTLEKSFFPPLPLEEEGNHLRDLEDTEVKGSLPMNFLPILC